MPCKVAKSDLAKSCLAKSQSRALQSLHVRLCKVGPRSSVPIIPPPDSLVLLDIARGEKEGDALLCIPGFLILAVPAMVVFAEDDHFRQRNGEKGEEKESVAVRSV